MNPALVARTEFINTDEANSDLLRTILWTMEHRARASSRTQLMNLQLGRLVLTALSLLLMAACRGTDSSDDRSDQGPGQTTVTVAGTASYQRVPPNANCNGLNFGGTFAAPIRGATVQLLDSSNTVLGTTVSADDGSYSFDYINANLMVRLRVRAERKQQGSPTSYPSSMCFDVSFTPTP